MSESWKNRLWQLVLVCTFAVVLSVCNKAVNSSSESSSSSGTAFADGSTVTISSLPNVTITSMPMPTMSNFMVCSSSKTIGTSGYGGAGVHIFGDCATTDTTELKTIIATASTTRYYAITLTDLHTSGFKPCSTAGQYYTWFCK